MALCDGVRIPLIRHSLPRDNLVHELLLGEAAADHTTVMHSMPFDFTTVLSVHHEGTETHFFLRLDTNLRDVSTHT